MNATTLEHILHRVIKPPYKFLGVFARDDLQRLPYAPPGSCFVINTDPSWRNGEHWVGIYVPLHRIAGTIIFFDSFALPVHLFHSSYFNVWMTRQAHRIETSPFAIQPNNSNACGPMVMFVLTHLAKYGDMLDQLIQNEFSPINLGDNHNKAWEEYKRLSSSSKK